MSPTLAGGFFTTESLGKPRVGSKSSDPSVLVRDTQRRDTWRVEEKAL